MIPEELLEQMHRENLLYELKITLDNIIERLSEKIVEEVVGWQENSDPFFGLAHIAEMYMKGEDPYLGDYPNIDIRGENTYIIVPLSENWEIHIQVPHTSEKEHVKTVMEVWNDINNLVDHLRTNEYINDIRAKFIDIDVFYNQEKKKTEDMLLRNIGFTEGFDQVVEYVVRSS